MKTDESEKEIEVWILRNLEAHRFFCWKVDYPIRFTKRGPAKSNHPYVRNGVSDILAIKGSIFLALEVKTPKELAWWDKNKNRILTRGPKNRKEKRFFDQFCFIEEVVKNGGYGGFTDGWERTAEIVSKAKEDRRRGLAGSLSTTPLPDMQESGGGDGPSHKDEG